MDFSLGFLHSIYDQQTKKSMEMNYFQIQQFIQGFFQKDFIKNLLDIKSNRIFFQISKEEFLSFDPIEHFHCNQGKLSSSIPFTMENRENRI